MLTESVQLGEGRNNTWSKRQVETELARTTRTSPSASRIKAIIAAAEPDWDIVDVPAPTVQRDDEGPVDYSYINHLVINGAVIACSFGDPNDHRAADILGEAYPGRTVITIDARPLFERGGGIHCITQQQPSAH